MSNGILCTTWESSLKGAPVQIRYPATTQGNLLVQVCLAANQELQRLQTLPTSSYKWTWCPTLTKDEVQSLWHITKQHVWSGYDTTLKSGHHNDESSSQDSPPSTAGTDSYSVVSPHALCFPSPMFLQYPAPFTSNPMSSSVSAVCVGANQMTHTVSTGQISPLTSLPPSPSTVSDALLDTSINMSIDQNPHQLLIFPQSPTNGSICVVM